MAHSAEPTTQNVQDEAGPTTVEKPTKRRSMAEPINTMKTGEGDGMIGNGEGNAEGLTTKKKINYYSK